jgi:aminomethyltransferase
MDAYAWAGMAMPWCYHTSLADEQRAVRERAGLADASQLQVVSVRGPAAMACVERLVPRRVDDLAVGASRFSVVLSRFGRICDEAIVMRVGEDELWISHGGGSTRAQLARLASPGAQVTALDDLHVLALQGPASARVLAAVAGDDVAALPAFAHRRAELAGVPGRVWRGGFTGELGFELFCAASDVVALWRRLLAAGAAHGLLPYAYGCVDLLRIEAGFLLYPAELALAGSLWEAGLGWLVRDKAGDYVGRDAVEATRGAARHGFAGLRLPGAPAIRRGAELRRAGRPVGTVTSSAFSPAAGETLCLAYVERDAIAAGAAVEVAEASVSAPLVALPFRPRASRG